MWVQPYTGLPTRTDPRATIYAARELGVERIFNWDMGIALSTVLQRGQPVVITDYIAWITHQVDTFLTTSQPTPDVSAANVRTAFCPQMIATFQQLLPGVPEAICLGADFLRRETPAEARMFRSWGADVLCYNVAPEVALAQEVGLCYGSMATISGYGADRRQQEPLGEVRASLSTTIEMLPSFVEIVSGLRTCTCGLQI